MIIHNKGVSITKWGITFSPTMNFQEKAKQEAKEKKVNLL